MRMQARILLCVLLMTVGATSAATDSYPFLLSFTDVVAKTAGLPLLRDQILEPGEKEIRVWIGFGVVAPEKMVRIMIDKTGHVSGDRKSVV